MANEFNNNNYLPGFPADMSGATYAQVLPSGLHFRAGSMPLPQNSFTFTTPTQCNTPATPRPCIQTTSPMGNMSAPGVGASWQHSIPTTMPWVSLSSPRPQIGLGNTSYFTGIPSQMNILPSCSSPMKRPKRKALDEPNGAPCSKVILCLDKFADLHISPNEDNKNNCQVDGTDNINSIWQHFQEIEDRLSMEEQEDSVLDLNSSTTTNEEEPVLKVADGILDFDKSATGVSPQPILPRKVLEEVQKPCLQLILWQSPAATIRDVLKGEEDVQRLDSPVTATSSSPSSQSSSSSPRTSFANVSTLRYSNNNNNNSSNNRSSSSGVVNSCMDDTMEVNMDDEVVPRWQHHKPPQQGFSVSPSSPSRLPASSSSSIIHKQQQASPLYSSSSSSSCNNSKVSPSCDNTSVFNFSSSSTSKSRDSVVRTSSSSSGGCEAVGRRGRDTILMYSMDDQDMQS